MVSTRLAADSTMAAQAKVKVLSAIIELMGIVIVSTGIGLELSVGGDAYLIVITLGSVVIATGGVLYAKVAR